MESPIGLHSARAHLTRVEIALPPADVWTAITDARSIERWFAPRMSVQPGVGGFVYAEWAPGLDWRMEVEVWDAPRHLRLTEVRAQAGLGESGRPAQPACRLVEDFRIEDLGGRSALELVHSGFGDSAAWQEEYESTPPPRIPARTERSCPCSRCCLGARRKPPRRWKRSGANCCLRCSRPASCGACREAQPTGPARPAGPDRRWGRRWAVRGGSPGGRSPLP